MKNIFSGRQPTVFFCGSSLYSFVLSIFMFAHDNCVWLLKVGLVAGHPPGKYLFREVSKRVVFSAVLSDNCILEFLILSIEISILRFYRVMKNISLV